MEKAPGGTVSEKILLQSCDWSVDLKLWWKRAEHLSLSRNWRLKCYIHMALWNCITFCHTALSILSKAPLLQCYENTSRGVFDLCAFECDFQCFLHFSVLLLKNAPPTHRHFLALTSEYAATLKHSTPNALLSYEGTHSNAKHGNELTFSVG